MNNKYNLFRVWSTAAFLLLAAGACVHPIIDSSIFVLPLQSDDKAITMMENNALCYSASLQRIGVEGVKEDVPNREGEGPVFMLEEPGTWIYLGRTPHGSIKAIVQKKEATPLPKASFGEDLEIQPKTHPTDIIPSADRMAKNATFSFAVLASGKPCEAPVSYVASCLGRAADQGGAPVEAKTKKGKGTLHIDAPGLWWITAEHVTDQGKRFLASLTFQVADKPGPDDYAAFTSDGLHLDGPDAIAEHLSDAEVIFIGEKHNDAVAHLLEKEILAAVHRKKTRVALTMEMFERDVQPVIVG